MGKVIALKNKNVDEEFVAYLEEVLAMARKGRARGAFGGIDLDDGTVRVFCRGSFASDKERAAQIASETLDVFCLRAGIPHPKFTAACALPPGLRKA